MGARKNLPCCGVLRSTNYIIEGENNYRDTDFGRCRNCGKKLHMTANGLAVDAVREQEEQERKRQAALPFHGEAK